MASGLYDSIQQNRGAGLMVKTGSCRREVERREPSRFFGAPMKGERLVTLADGVE